MTLRALNADFGNRAAEVSGITDVGGSIGPLKHARQHLKAWMRPERRKTTPALLGWLGAKAEVIRNGTPLDLSAREFLLLKYFIEHREATLTRDELLNEVWGYHSMPSTRTVDVHVAWLRQKIEDNPKHPQYILTVHGMGYKFVG